MPIEPIIVKKFKRESKVCEPPAAKKLDLTGDLTITQHMAFLQGKFFLAQDMQGILEHEVLAIGRARWRTIFYAFDGERWEKRLFLENAQLENYAIDADSNFYFIAVQYRAIDHNSDDCAEFCVGCIDKQGDLLWQYSCRDEGEEMFEELHSLVNERRCGEILINEDQLLLLYAIPNTESAVKIKARDLNGRELWTREIKNAGNVLDKYALAVNDGIIEVLHGNYLERFSKDGEDLGRIVFDPSYWIEHLWRFDQKIIFSVNRGTWKERYFIFDGPDWLIEYDRTTGETRVLDNVSLCGAYSYYYAGKYFSTGGGFDNEQGEMDMALSIEREPGDVLKILEVVQHLAGCPVADDLGSIYLISGVAFPSRKTRKLQRIVLSPDNEIIKNDVYKSQEKDLLEISKVLYHHGKIYVISLWQGNKKEQELYRAKERTGEIPGRLLPIEELDVYDLEKAGTDMKTGLTIIEAK